MNTTDEKLQQSQEIGNDFKFEMEVLANKTLDRMNVMFKDASDRQEASMHMFRDMMDSYYQHNMQIMDSMSKMFVDALRSKSVL